MPAPICENLFTSGVFDFQISEQALVLNTKKGLGVKKCGATHCTGDMQIKMFRDSFGDDYFELVAGNIIVIN